jgi:beta-glucosidase
VDTLLEAGIEPWITLFHWDYPFELFCKGGWLNPDCSEWFAEYTAVVMKHFSDRVGHWITINEPKCFIIGGHEKGTHAPGVQLSRPEILRAIHGMLLSHGKAVSVIRSAAKTAPKIGLAYAARPVHPDTDSEADRAAARTVMFDGTRELMKNNTWWMDPVYFGQYPEDGIEKYGADMPEISQEEMKIIGQDIDLCCLNIYGGERVRRGNDGTAEGVAAIDGCPMTAFKWDITPESMHFPVLWFYRRYGKPVVITENGMSISRFTCTVK